MHAALGSWGGKISRGRFLLAGGALTAVKCAVDAAISAAFGQPWTPLMYVSPRVSPLLHFKEVPGYWIALAVAAIPFVVAGLILCMGRLRDVGVKPLWCGLFFAPFLHWVFFLVLAVTPPSTTPEKPDTVPSGEAPPPEVPVPTAAAPDTKPVGTGAPAGAPHARVRLISTVEEREPSLLPLPESAAARFLVGVATSFVLSLVGFGLAKVAPQTDVPFLNKEVLGVGLFFGLPFGIGFLSAFVVSYDRDSRSAGLALLAAGTSFVAGMIALVAMEVEGAACIVMAAPILGFFTLVGAIVGHFTAKLPAPRVGAALAMLLVLLLWGDDYARPPKPVELAMVSEVRIEATPDVVWKHVTAVSPIDEPAEPIFAICAMPLESRLVGEGVGARRSCVLTVGTIEETVEVWQPNRELTFRVDRAPERFARYGALERGQFLLIPNADGSTTVRGTSWYRLNVAPAAYWSLWTQTFVHAVHERVFRHVKRLSEDPSAVASTAPAEQPEWMRGVNATCNCTRHAEGP